MSRFRDVFGLDVRSLAAFRIALGLIILVDLAFRATDFSAMYGPEGLAPVEMMRSLDTGDGWSLHLAGGAVWQASLMVAAALVASALVAGWHTRLATVGSWVLLVSLHNRLTIILTGADVMLRMLLLWAMFLPTGEVWSLDARRTPVGCRRSTVVSLASVALVLQLALVYWLSGYAKWNDTWLHNDALSNILTSRLFAMPPGRLLAELSSVTPWMSKAVVWFELAAPCLLFLPFWTAWWRVVVIAAMVAFHVGIVVTVSVALFSWVAMAGWLALVPGVVWDRSGVGNRAVGGNQDGAPPAIASKVGFVASLGRVAACALCGVALATVLYANWCNVFAARLPAPIHRALQHVAQAGSLRQGWAMFGDAPVEDGWFVYEAELADGRQLDLLEPNVALDAGDHMLSWQATQNDRWRKLHWNLQFDFGRPFRQPVAEYVCRRWNATHGPEEQIVHLAALFYLELVRDGGSKSQFVTTKLADVVVGGRGGNFAEALRGGDAY
jgi:hypothetical protein